MGNKILVIADDLTGAGDIAYWALEKNLKVIIDVNNIENEFPKNADVLIKNTNTRHSAVDKAYKSVFDICVWARSQKIKYVYKKIDSALRGNFVREIDAVCDALSITFMPLVAAFPEQGRTTKNGHHFINGILINKSEFSKDPKAPVTESYIPGFIKRASGNADRITVYDAETSGDMQNIVNKIDLTRRNMPGGYCSASGASRFFGELLKTWTIPHRKEKEFSIDGFDCIVIICGSVNPASRRQAEFLIAEKELEIKETTLGYDYYSKENMYLCITPDNKLRKFDLSLIAIKTQNILKNVKKPLIIVCGGDTARAVCGQLKINILEGIQGIAPGIITAKDISSAKYIILKPGGFGEKNLLVNLIKGGL
ncbi:MAG: four-carbon acid sugar kinase family protein [Elusimicrobiota bacterium]